MWTTKGPPTSVHLLYVAAGVVVAVAGVARLSKRPKLDTFPTIGASGWLGSWWAGVKYVTNTADVVHEGYKKYRGAPFKIAMLYHWTVILTTRAHIEELRNARDDERAHEAAMDEDYGFEYTMGPKIFHNPYHITVIRSHFTRNIGAVYPELRDEIVTAFSEILDLNEWKIIPALATIQQVICRATNRAFVGLPLCRNPDYVHLNIQHTVDFIEGNLVVPFFPDFLRLLIVHLATNIPRNTRRAVGHLRPVIEERRKYLNEYGKDWTEKPRDLLSWLMDEGGADATVEALTGRMLMSNISAIHASSIVFINALYNLAANPQYVRPLRDEVEDIVKEEGWSETSVGKMRKVDSFFKESIRTEGPAVLGMTHKAQSDLTFSDGTFIPKGTRLSASLAALHHDNALYENPEVFDPFRFANLGEEDEEATKHQFVATSAEYLPFGHGRHACPGRFFAGIELKTMLAHIVTSYDIKLDDNSPRSRSMHTGLSIMPDPTAKVMFRNRVRERNINS